MSDLGTCRESQSRPLFAFGREIRFGNQRQNIRGYAFARIGDQYTDIFTSFLRFNGNLPLAFYCMYRVVQYIENDLADFIAVRAYLG